MNADASGELRAFVAARVGGHSWIVDLLPNYALSIGSAPDADVRIESQDVEAKQATIGWDGKQITVVDLSDGGTEVNGETVEGKMQILPGDEITLGPATLRVNVTVAPIAHGRRSLTHAEFCERLQEELARASRRMQPTSLVMMKTKSGDGSAVASAALGSFREGDIVGTYAHDEIEFLLPDTPPGIAQAVVNRVLHMAGADRASAGLAVAPEDGDSAERLLRSARDALATALATEQRIARRGQVEERYDEPSIHSPQTRLVVEDVQRAAETGEPVLLHGEPNSGKRQYAHLLHERGTRSSGPFSVVACAGMLDAEALDHAFGDAEGNLGDSSAGNAVDGTLLLEEIGDLPVQGQRRLLRVLEKNEDKFNVVATTHRDLQALAQVGAFLPNLYERVAVRRIGVPALRMRTESIVPLGQKFAAEFQPDAPVKLSPSAIEKMRSYSWPGNVLELRNAMERAVRLADGGEILAEHLPGDAHSAEGSEGRLRQHVGSVERDAIIKALADNNYNQTHAARQLGVSRRALIYKMEKYGLKPPPSGQSPRK